MKHLQLVPKFTLQSTLPAADGHFLLQADGYLGDINIRERGTAFRVQLMEQGIFC
jgi:hypothetical protein